VSDAPIPVHRPDRSTRSWRHRAGIHNEDSTLHAGRGRNRLARRLASRSKSRGGGAVAAQRVWQSARRHPRKQSCAGVADRGTARTAAAGARPANARHCRSRGGSSHGSGFPRCCRSGRVGTACSRPPRAPALSGEGVARLPLGTSAFPIALEPNGRAQWRHRTRLRRRRRATCSGKRAVKARSPVSRLRVSGCNRAERQFARGARCRL
jgi:hypothetical protein